MSMSHTCPVMCTGCVLLKEYTADWPCPSSAVVTAWRAVMPSSHHRRHGQDETVLSSFVCGVNAFVNKCRPTQFPNNL